MVSKAKIFSKSLYLQSDEGNLILQTPGAVLFADNNNEVNAHIDCDSGKIQCKSIGIEGHISADSISAISIIN